MLLNLRSANAERPTGEQILFSLYNARSQGAVFALSVRHVRSHDCLRLAAAAEDRSIAVWTNPSGGDGSSSTCSMTQYTGPWSLFCHLKGGGVDGTVIFESRIWSVVLDDWGVAAVGEVGNFFLRICVVISPLRTSICSKSLPASRRQVHNELVSSYRRVPHNFMDAARCNKGYLPSPNIAFVQVYPLESTVPSLLH